MRDMDLDETECSQHCDFYIDYEKVNANRILNAFFDGHPLKDFNFDNYYSIFIECSCGKKTIITHREMLHRIIEIKEILENDNFKNCKEHYKKYNFYSEELNKNLCDQCLDKDKLNNTENFFNFDNNFYSYKEMGEKIEEKFKNDEDTSSQIKDAFRIIFEEFKRNYHEYSFFVIIKGFYIFFIKTNQKKCD